MEPKRKLDKREMLLRNRTIEQVNVQWKHLSPEDSTWELGSNMWEAYPFLFQDEIMEE